MLILAPNKQKERVSPGGVGYTGYLILVRRLVRERLERRRPAKSAADAVAVIVIG
jgi:hypothetical protein